MITAPFRPQSFNTKLSHTAAFTQADLDDSFRAGKEEGARQSSEENVARLCVQLEKISQQLSQYDDALREARKEAVRQMVPAIAAITAQCASSTISNRLAEAVSQQLSIAARQVSPGEFSIHCHPGEEANITALVGDSAKVIADIKGELQAEIRLPGGSVQFDARHLISSLDNIIQTILEDPHG